MLMKKHHTITVLDKNGRILLDREQKLGRGKEFIEELFYDNRLLPKYLIPEVGSSITKEEEIHTMKTMKNGKSQDKATIDLLKCIDEKHFNTILELFNKIYMSGNISRDLLMSKLI